MLVLLACLAIALLAGLVLQRDWDIARDYFYVLLLGSVIGVGDVLNRHPEAPMTTLGTPGACVRIVVNAAASALALWVLKDNPFGAQAVFDDKPSAQILVAGFGALALLRVTFKVAFGGAEFDLSLAAVIDQFLQAADRDAMGRSAAASAEQVFAICRDVDFGAMSARVAPICLTLPESLTEDQRKQAFEQIQKICDDSKLLDSDKTLLIGSTIAKAIGREALRAVVENVLRTTSSSRASVFLNAMR